MSEWNIQSRAYACQACEKAFTDKHPFHTLLFEEKQEYQRLDICPECWAAQYRDGANDRKGFISQWQGIFQAPPAAPPDPILKESAESLLRKLIEANDPKYAPVCYILAVMLERKRVFKTREQIQRDGGRVFIYEHGKTGDIFTIADPNLQLKSTGGSAAGYGQSSGAWFESRPLGDGSRPPPPAPEPPQRQESAPSPG